MVAEYISTNVRLRIVASRDKGITDELMDCWKITSNSSNIQYYRSFQIIHERTTGLGDSESININ